MRGDVAGSDGSSGARVAGAGGGLLSQSYECVVIGSGPGGYAAAMAARRQGWRVGLVERGAVGGVCLNVGCIPTKALIAVGHAMRRIRQAEALGIRIGRPELDYAALHARNARIVEQLRQGMLALLRHQQIDVIAGDARLDDPHTIRVAPREGEPSRIAAERIILATGAQPTAGLWAFDGRRILSYRDLLAAASLPSSLLIVGGGVIGCEFASCFANFGVPVTIVEPQPQLLPAEDPEAVRVVAHSLAVRGVTVLAGTSVQTLEGSAAGVRAVLSSGQTCEAAQCLIAIGQRPNSRGLGLEALGIPTEGGIAVDDSLRTRHPHIAAIGDCLPRHGLAHLAAAEGLLAVRNLAGPERQPLDRQLVPRCVYTDPELAHVGVLESEAAAEARVSRIAFAAVGKSVCDDEPEGFVKLLIDPSSQRVLGATIVGAQASSLIPTAVVAMTHGLTARQLADTITAHPTLAEGVTEAAAQCFGEALYARNYLRAPRTPPAIRNTT